VETGFLETTPGAEIDMNVIIEGVRWASQVFDLQEATFDRWGGSRQPRTCCWFPKDLRVSRSPRQSARDTASKRIDGVAATITAMARAQFAGEHGIRFTTYSVG
jgi:phage terminase large subunit-like protein